MLSVGMLETVLAGTDIRVSCLGYGTGSLHHCFRASERQGLLHEAAELGIRHFDTAPSYGFGLAETDLGEFLRGRRSQFTVATKVGLYPLGNGSQHAAAVWARKALGRAMPCLSAVVADWHVARARQSLDRSLRRLGTDYVDFLFLHEPDVALIAGEEFLDWLRSEARRGRIRAWGVAGLKANVAPFVAAESPLAQVVQTLDSLEHRQADFLLDHRRPLQFTYGYFSAAGRAAAEPIDVLRRNQTGTVLISTRRTGRLRALCELAR